jgi:hypothetical protein
MNPMHKDYISVLCPTAQIAEYSEPSISIFKGNRFINALPTLPEDDKKIRLLFSQSAPIDENAMELDTSTRKVLANMLKTVRIPLFERMNVIREVDAIIRTGYLNSARCMQRHSKYQQLIMETPGLARTGQVDEDLLQPFVIEGSPESGLLTGDPGLGKTELFRSIVKFYQRVIYHPEVAQIQIPVLHLDYPSGAKSVGVIATQIIKKIQSLVPAVGPEIIKVKDSVPERIHTAAYLLAQFNVGLLVVDEIQTLLNAKAGRDSTIDNLLLFTNALPVPVIFAGTEDAIPLFNSELYLARRAVGLENPRLLPLAKPSDSQTGVGPYTYFLKQLARYRLLKNKVEITPELSLSFYECTHGNLGLTVEHYILCTKEAISNKSEAITPELVRYVYDRDMALVKSAVFSENSKKQHTAEKSKRAASIRQERKNEQAAIVVAKIKGADVNEARQKALTQILGAAAEPAL